MSLFDVRLFKTLFLVRAEIFGLGLRGRHSCGSRTGSEPGSARTVKALRRTGAVISSAACGTRAALRCLTRHKRFARRTVIFVYKRFIVVSDRARLAVYGGSCAVCILPVAVICLHAVIIRRGRLRGAGRLYDRLRLRGLRPGGLFSGFGCRLGGFFALLRFKPFRSLLFRLFFGKKSLFCGNARRFLRGFLRFRLFGFELFLLYRGFYIVELF